jgi:hypothetical protein
MGIKAIKNSLIFDEKKNNNIYQVEMKSTVVRIFHFL